jgi:hypothetical protein
MRVLRIVYLIFKELFTCTLYTRNCCPIVEQLQVGDEIEVVGAIKWSKKDLDDPLLIITPAQITSQ